MKKLFLFLNLFLLMFVAGTGKSFASKKYRYIKREHGVRFQGNIPMSFQGFTWNANLAGAYAYNWKGMIEVGPYFALAAGTSSGAFQLNSWAGGLLVEYNFIKNRGKRKFIPALGVTVGASKGGVGPELALGAHVSLKSFVAKRTAFITTLAYRLHTPVSGIFTSMIHHVEPRMGFAYYFDFY